MVEEALLDKGFKGEKKEVWEILHIVIICQEK